MFTVVHIGPLATGIQSLMLLFQVMESRKSVSGRYYQALYTKLMDPALKHSGKQVSHARQEYMYKREESKRVLNYSTVTAVYNFEVRSTIINHSC